MPHRCCSKKEDGRDALRGRESGAHLPRERVERERLFEVKNSRLGMAAAHGVDNLPAPGAPTNIVATPGDRSAGVSWTAPPNGGAAITGYMVTPYIGDQPLLVANTPETREYRMRSWDTRTASSLACVYLS